MRFLPGCLTQPEPSQPHRRGRAAGGPGVVQAGAPLREEDVTGLPTGSHEDPELPAIGEAPRGTGDEGW